MMLKEGDKVTVGCNPTIKVGEGFLFFKPYASVARTLSDDVMGDLQDMQAELRKQLFRALQTEIVGVSDIYEALGDNAEIDDLLKLCEKEVGNVEAQSTFQVHQGEGKSQGSVTKKGPGKSTKAKPGGKKKPPGATLKKPQG